MRRGLVLIAIGVAAVVAGALILSPVGSGPVNAVNNGTITVGATTIPAGGTTSVAATFSIDPPAPLRGRPATISLTVTGGTTGTLLLSGVMTTGPLTGCVITSALGGSTVTCNWTNAKQGQPASIAATATASANAIGVWTTSSAQVTIGGSSNVVATGPSITVTPAMTTTTAVT